VFIVKNITQTPHTSSILQQQIMHAFTQELHKNITVHSEFGVS